MVEDAVQEERNDDKQEEPREIEEMKVDEGLDHHDASEKQKIEEIVVEPRQEETKEEVV